MNTVLLPFQKEGVRLIEQFKGRALQADDMGLGKTIQVLAYLKRNPRPGPAIAIVPASVKFQWQAEAATHVRMNSEVIEGTSPIRAGAIPSKCPLIILNYDIVKYHVEYLRDLEPNLIVLDECQNISSPVSQRTQAALEVARGVQRILGTSGTPLMNRPIELFTIVNLLWPKTFKSIWEFGWKYCKPQLQRGKWEFRGAQNLPALHALLIKKGMIRRTKEEVMPDLPPKMRHVVPMDLLDWGEYYEASENFARWIRKNKPKKARKALRMEQLTRINYLLSLVARLKMRNVNEWIQQFLDDTDEKIVVFCNHIKMMDALRRKFPHSVHINGAVTGRKRKTAVDQFVHDKKTRIIFGNQAMSAGISGLQTVATSLAFTELFWRPADHTQGGDRIRRIGQKSTTWEYWLVAGGTIEERMCEILQTKQRDVSDVLDGEGRGESLSVLDMLIAAEAKKVKAK